MRGTWTLGDSKIVGEILWEDTYRWAINVAPGEEIGIAKDGDWIFTPEVTLPTKPYAVVAHTIDPDYESYILDPTQGWLITQYGTKLDADEVESQIRRGWRVVFEGVDDV